MKIAGIHNTNNWFADDGPFSDVVISSRIRLARNLAGFPFTSKCSMPDKQVILDKLLNTFENLDLGEELFFASIDKTKQLDRQLLVERHLISTDLAKASGPRAVAIAPKKHFTAMINEEDHLRMQIIKPGLQLKKCFDDIDAIDDMVEAKNHYSFHKKYGYLTACLTNVGTGIRASVMLHLPALKITGKIQHFINAARDMNLAVRGFFGEGSRAVGDFYQLSNHQTLGITETQIVKMMQDNIVPEIIHYENKARQQLFDKNHMNIFDDKIARALALLKNAHLISSHEALQLLSQLRLGISIHNRYGNKTAALCRIGQLKENSSHNFSIATINQLFTSTLPAHLQLNHGKNLAPTDRDVLRAKIIRTALS